MTTASPPTGEGATVAARVGRGTASSWLVWLASRALTLLTLVLLTRALPPDQLGSVFSAIAIGVLGASLAMGGLPDATTRHAASASASQEPFGWGDVRRSLLRFVATLPLITGILIIVAVSSPDGTSAGVVVASLLLAATQGGTTIIASIYRARGEAARYVMVTNFLTSLGRAAVAALVLIIGHGGGVFVLWTFVALNIAVIAATWSRAMSGLPRTESKAEGDGAIQLGGVLWSLFGNLDVVVVGAVLGAAAAGQYGASLRLAEFAIQFIVAFAVPYLPEATRLAVSGARGPLQILYRTAGRWSTLVTLLAAGVGFVAAPALGHIVYPHDPSGTTHLLRVLFIGYAVHGALGQTYSTMLALGDYRAIRLSGLIGLPLVVALTIGLTEAFGAVGAASATASVYVVSGIAWALVVGRGLRTAPFDERYPRAVVACAGAVGIAVLAAVATRGAPPLGQAAGIMSAGFVAWAVFVPLSGALTGSERARLDRLLPARLRTSA
jgi:O-antigen/teichoic acid export membrane protein